MKVDRAGFSNNVQAPPPSVATASHIPPFNSHVNNASLNQGQAGVAPSEQDCSRAGYPLSQNPPLDFPNAQIYYPYPICVPGSYLHYPSNHQNGVRLITSPKAQISTVPGPYPSRLTGKKPRYNTRYQASLSGGYPQCGGIVAPQGNLNGSAVIQRVGNPFSVLDRKGSNPTTPAWVEWNHQKTSCLILIFEFVVQWSVVASGLRVFFIIQKEGLKVISVPLCFQVIFRLDLLLFFLPGIFS